MRLWVSMGIRPAGRIDAPLRPRLKEVVPDTGRTARVFAWESPPAHTSGPDADQEFTCASLTPEGLLLQPTHSDLLWIEPETLRVVRTASHPLFHGVHSATPDPDGGVVLTCAGTDSVLELDAGGGLRAHHHLRAGVDFRVAHPESDLRQVHYDAYKPHAFHPNHAVRVGEALWVTSFETRDCIDLRSRRRIALPEGIPHDGRLRQGWLWFTQVHGHVVAVDPVSGERRLELDLNELCPGPGLLGWCRGIEVVGSRLFVGMTMLRRPRHREVLRWLARGRAGVKRPTRILEIDLDSRRLVREIEVGNAAGGTIYGLVAR
jgi:hypothetical protein